MNTKSGGVADADRGMRWADRAVPAAVVVALVVLSLRRYLVHLNADGLLYALISTEDLTFFYWQQDRLANLVPLLAWPVRDVAPNLMVQMVLIAGAFHLLIMAIAGFHLRARGIRAHGWMLGIATATTALVYGAAVRPRSALVFVIEQQYAVSTLLGFAGLWLLVDRRWQRRAAGAALVIAATVVIPSFVLLAPVAGLLLGDDESGTQLHWSDWRRWRPLWPVAAATIAAWVTTTVASSVFADVSQQGVYTDFSLGRLRRELWSAVSSIAGTLDLSTCVPVLGVAIAVLGARWRHVPRCVRSTLILGVAYAVGWLLLFSANAWVQQGSVVRFRYYFPVYVAGFVLVSAAVVEISVAVRERVPALWITRRAQRPIALASSAALTAIALGAASTLSVDRIGDLEAIAPLALTVERHDVEFVVGDYWTVWPTTFRARADGFDVIGVAFRSTPLADDARALVAVAGPGSIHRVLCAWADIARCEAELTAFTGLAWSVGETVVTEPLVVEFIAGS
jgi:hypothetical protein